MPSHATPAHERHDDWITSRRGRRRLVAAAVGGPVLYLTGHHLLYAVVHPDCHRGGAFAVHVLGAIALALVLGACWAAWRAWRRLGGAWPRDAGGPVERSRLLATLGMMLGGVSALIVAGMWLATAFYGPCQGL